MLNSFCGFRLNTVGVVIGWLGVVGSIVFVILTSLGLANADAVAEAVAQLIKDKSDRAPDINDIRTFVVVACGVYLAGCLINLLSSGMLVLGTIRERHLMLLPWLVNNGISLFFTVIHNVALLVSLFDSESTSNALPAVFVSILVFMIQFYVYYAIYSLYKHLQANRDQQRPLINNAEGHSGTTYPSYTKI